MDKKQLHVLLTDVGLRKVFDLYNCLNCSNYKTILACNKKEMNSLIYARKIYKLRKSNAVNFHDDVLDIIENLNGEIIYFPCEEDTTLLFYEFIEKYKSDNLKYALPDKKVFELVRNKKRLSRFCDENKIPCPKEFALEDLRKSFAKVVAKPAIGTGAKGLLFIDCAEQLVKLDSVNLDAYLLQEQLPNPSNICGAFFLFNKGKLVSYYGHRRIRTYPVKAGVSVYSKIEFNEDIEKTGEELLSKLNWHGIAMIEFLFDPAESVYKVIEVNPRLWGSFLLSEFGNSGFIDNYIRISRGQGTLKKEPRENVYLRWFFPFDILNYISAKGKIRDFWKIDKAKTCYVGFTYSNIYRSMAFILCSVFDVKKIGKFISKVMS